MTTNEQATVDLTTTYLGLELSHPVVASSSPLTGSVDGLTALQDGGAAAVVLPSLFEEQVEHDYLSAESEQRFGAEFNVEAADGYFPALDDYNTGPDQHLDLLVGAKRELTVPLSASGNGTADGGWTHDGKALEDEGADALELNVYHIAADPDATATDVEDRYLRLVERVRAQIEIPMAVKIGPFFSSPANLARRLTSAGADGLVLFNRFYQPDIDLDTLDVSPDLVLSSPDEMRLVLRWMAILHGRVDVDLGATSGVHDAEGALKVILAGATVAMMTSALLLHGPGRLREVVDGMDSWLAANDYASVDQARGSVSQTNATDPDAFERANYMRTLTSYRHGG
ncbi:MAG: dihydroorotate dehydrogenase-like protein [Acidimicrobiales bacterium]